MLWAPRPFWVVPETLSKLHLRCFARGPIAPQYRPNRAPIPAQSRRIAPNRVIAPRPNSQTLKRTPQRGAALRPFRLELQQSASRDQRLPIQALRDTCAQKKRNLSRGSGPHAPRRERRLSSSETLPRAACGGGGSSSGSKPPGRWRQHLPPLQRETPHEKP